MSPGTTRPSNSRVQSTDRAKLAEFHVGAASAPEASHVDELDISPEADLVSRAREVPDVRQELVARIREEIQAGTYETDAKLDVAMDRLLDEIG